LHALVTKVNELTITKYNLWDARFEICDVKIAQWALVFFKTLLIIFSFELVNTDANLMANKY